MDRWMIGLFMQPIKEEFQLSDTQLGFLTGIAFALFYSTLGIPLARWADRGDRVTITSISIALWGGMVMLCGMVTNFLQLILVRIGAAVGEAGVMPPAYSLIADYFIVPERTRAVSIYLMALPTSILMSYLLAGWVGELFGWRIAFLLIGVPGLAMAVLIKFTIREPRHQKALSIEPLLPLTKVIKFLWGRQSFRYLIIGLTLMNFVGIGVGQWYATFFIRSHGMTLGDLGIWLGLIFGLGGAVATFLGGYIANRFLANNTTAQVRLAAAIPILTFPLMLALLLTPNSQLALLLLIPMNMMNFLALGPIYAVILQLVESQMRATAMAIVSLVTNLIGIGLGPQTVGILSDSLTPYLGTDALRTAMIISALVSFGAAYYYWIAANTIKVDPFLKQNNKISVHATTKEQDLPSSFHGI